MYPLILTKTMGWLAFPMNCVTSCLESTLLVRVIKILYLYSQFAQLIVLRDML